MKSLVIVPTYNERENIEDLSKEILIQDPGIEVLIVDDNSPDGTGALADELSQKSPRIHVLHRSGKQGLGTAYIAGFKYALQHDFDFVFEMDGDFSHEPKYLPEFFKKMQAGYDLVVGSRYLKGISVAYWDLWRLLLSLWASFYARLVTGVPLTDPMAGFKCFSRKILENIDLDKVKSNGYSFQIEMNYRAFKKGFRLGEIPIIFVERRQGQSKMSKKVILEAILMPWRLRLRGGD